MDDFEETPGNKPLRLPKKAAKVKNKVRFLVILSAFFFNIHLMIYKCSFNSFTLLQVHSNVIEEFVSSLKYSSVI